MPLQITEDTPPDMLAGSMDLLVLLPNGHTVKMNVERSTPMMDLLVQATTLNKISPGGHVLQPLGEHGILPYKPSTPIGALDTWTLQVVSKSKAAQPASIAKKAPVKPAPQPFEQTFRLQVHLPRNQLYVMRVSSRTPLCDILQQTCGEKNLDPSKYEMRHPANLSQLLNPSCTLADYGLQEVTVMARSGRAPSDIMALQREEDKRRQQARQQHSSGGVAIVFNKHSQSSVCEGSISSDSLGGRSISPARSDESASRSASPPAPSLPPMMAPPPARPARKRRPAPKPPGPTEAPLNKQQTNEEAEASNVAVSHSRNSSDSSGYHEASVLSDSPPDVQPMQDASAPDTLPRRGKQMAARPKSQGGLSRSMSSLTSCQHSTSNTSLASSTGLGQKKKKAPPPPPRADHISKTTSLERHISGKTNTQLLLDKSSTLPGKMKMSYDRRTPSPEVNIPEEVARNSSPEARPASRIVFPEEQSRAPSTGIPPSFRTPSPDIEAPPEVETIKSIFPEIKAIQPLPEAEPLRVPPSETEAVTVEPPPVVLAAEPRRSPSLEPPGDVESASELDDDVDQVEEAFRSVTAELEAAIQRDEEVNILPPPPMPGDDLTVDWEYQLPAPPSAFRDMESPTNSTTAALVLSEPSLSPEPQEVDVHLNRNEVTRSNPLFVPHEFEDELSTMVVPPLEPSRSESRSREAGLSNFTITTYQRPHVTEDIFSEEEDTFKKPGALQHKFGSTSALNSGTSLSRTNSFNEDNISTFKQPANVKRSTSYISLIANQTARAGKPFQPSYAPVASRTKSVGNLTRSDDTSSPLQSLQVLRSILPQLSQPLPSQTSRSSPAPQVLSDSIKPNNESKPAPTEPKRYVYRGPPAVNFTTWSERPKTQVSIKMDGDYRIGVGQGGQSDKPAEPVSIGVVPLTMHLVLPPPDVRRPAQKIETKEVGVARPSDPSRVPIVRAVELKKSFIEQQNLNNGTDQRNEIEEQFLGVNSLAKRFSGPSLNRFHPSRPLSAYGKIENCEPKSLNTDFRSVPAQVKSDNVDSTQTRRYTSVIGINSEPDVREPRGLSVVRVNGFTAPKHLMPVVKGFQFAAPAANKVQRSESTSGGVRTWKTDQMNESKSEPAPVVAALRKSTARPRPKTLPSASVNPRDQLMDAIRNFGGRENLRQITNSRDNVVLIR